MADAIVVVHSPQGWRLHAGDRWWGRYDFQVDAVEAALRFRRERRVAGPLPKIVVQERFGELRDLPLDDPHPVGKRAALARAAPPSGVTASAEPV